MSIPADLRYTESHEWIKVESGRATVGITQFAQEELGELVFVDLPASGKAFSKGASICVVESTKAASDVYAPVSGSVIEVNTQLQDRPDLVNKDPYGEGWLLKLEKFSQAEVDSLMTSEKYASYIAGKK